jgi:phosphoglycolate phosphatase/putative hydrolase of the HAD superfamily
LPHRFEGSQLKAVVFDVDGTLYSQRLLRRGMLVRLLAMLAARPVAGWQTLRVLRAYRRAQEHLRNAAVSGDVAAAQIRLTCERTNVGREAVVECVSRWMEREPLPLMARCVQPGILEFLHACKARGLRLGALSDYPAEAKLHALGVIDLFDIVLCAQAPDINVFKPNPRGLLVAIERLAAAGPQSLYVGDRVDVDAPTAEAAGVRCAILTRRRTPKALDSHIQVASYSELSDLLWR